MQKWNKWRKNRNIACFIRSPFSWKERRKKINRLPLWLNTRTLINMTGNCVKEEEPPSRIELRINALWAMRDDVMHDAAYDCVRMNKYVYRLRARFQSWAIIKMNKFHAFAFNVLLFFFLLSVHYPLHPATYTAVMISYNNKHGNLLFRYFALARALHVRSAAPRNNHTYSTSKTFKW